MKDGVVVSRDAPVDDKVQKIQVMVFDRGLHGLGSVTVPIDGPPVARPRL
jgi:hypothetical protein